MRFPDEILDKYADLLVNYCLSVSPGEEVYIQSTPLAEPLVIRVYEKIIQAGGHPFINLLLAGQQKIFFKYAQAHQLSYHSPITRYIYENFNGYLNIRAPYDLEELLDVDPQKLNLARQAKASIHDIYMKRTASGELKRCLCEYPVPATAQQAKMPLKDFAEFVFNACFLYEDNPVESWLKIRAYQQRIVDYLNRCNDIRYNGPNIDLSFSVAGRTWINSDGKTNMPSGEVYTAPVEDSVNGWVYFTVPSIYQGKRVEGVRLTFKDGEVVDYDAGKGKTLLDEIFQLPNANRLGEIAIGTNKHINRFTGIILFDEKIGGTVHMALGQAYYQTGGKNKSPIHWDLITDMKDGGKIYADGQLIYENGEFLI